MPAALAIAKLPQLEGYRRRLLGTGSSGNWRPGWRGRLDELLHGPVQPLWLRLESWPERAPARRTEKATLLLGGDAGVEVAELFNELGLDLDQPVGTLTLREASPVYETVERILAEADEPCRVVQVGSSSGREIAWVAERFPDVPCVGTDLVPEVVGWSSEHHRAPNLTFATVSAKDVGDFAAPFADERVIVFASGSLQQVQPEHLDQML